MVSQFDVVVLKKELNMVMRNDQGAIVITTDVAVNGVCVRGNK